MHCVSNSVIMADDMDETEFYGNGEKYWATIKPTVDGMLGGYSHISSADIAGSVKFLSRFVKPKGEVSTKHALDCGAGIGRITKTLLLPMFAKVDMVDVNQTFLDEAKNSYLEKDASRVERYICSGLQEFTPEPGRYSVIWCQWVLGQLTDQHLIEFFQRCQKGLTPDGMIFVKENVSRDSQVDFDDNDSSYCRPKGDLVALMKHAGLKVVAEEKQKQFPKELYEVRMYALK